MAGDQRCDGRTAILLFHDSLGCVELWREFPEQLAIRTRLPVVAYDRLGFGYSDEHPGALSLSFIRDEAISTVPRICEALALDTIIPFGHSVGGAMAVATAAQLPNRCAIVITESAQSFVEDRTIRGVHAAEADFKRPEHLQRLAKYHGSKTRWVLDAWIKTWLSPAFADWCLDQDLRRVRARILALHGDNDEYGSTEHPKRIARLAGGESRMLILKKCGHIPHRQQPKRVLDEVAGFLAIAD